MNILQFGLFNFAFEFKIPITLGFNKSTDKCLLRVGYVRQRENNKVSFKISNHLTKKLYKKWYKLKSEKDFDVEVYDKDTGKIYLEYSRAVKLFLQDMRSDTYTKGFVLKYMTFSEDCNNLIIKNKLTKKSESQIQYYKELYFCLNTIERIIAPRTCYITGNTKLYDAFIPDGNDFHFSFELDDEEFDEIIRDRKDNGNNFYAIELSNKILCERILPEFYLNLGYQSEDFLKANPAVKNICNYMVGAH